MFRFSSLLLLATVLGLLQHVFATPYFTAPVGSTTDQGGQKLHVEWIDDGKSPALNTANWGNSTIYLATGSQNTQYKLQTLAQNVPPSRKQGSYTVDKTIGPNGQFYFIRMEGSSKDSAGNPVMAFSAKFTLNGMSGTFNSTLQAAASGASPATGSSSAAAGGASSSSLATSRSSSTGISSPTSVSAAAAASGSRTSSAGRLTIGNGNTVATLLAVLSTGALAAVGMVLV